MEKHSNSERLARIEGYIEAMKDDVMFIKENMVSKSVITVIKWSLGGVASLALAALLLAGGK